tara:strand:+ start:326 stop:1273 length:948 start_codon:yes stop_codon:yes gene_type:complete
MLTLAPLGQNSNADFKSTFLIDTERLSTLSYLSDNRSDAWRADVRGAISNDTHADILARNTDKVWGIVDGVGSNWRSRLQELGKKPVIWLISDDSPELYARGLSNQIDYQSKVVSEVDDIVSHYVVCLECDEYYTPSDVSTLIAELRKKTDKPIGVHLTPGVKQEYIKDADIIYLQTGFDLNEQQFRQQIENALRFGKPVVVSEYNLQGTSAEAKRFGDIACSYAGVVGTGNGRGSSSCETLNWQKRKKKKWYQENEKELIVTGIGIVTLFAVLNRKPTFQLQVNDNGYELGLQSAGYNLRYSEDKIQATYRIDF